MLNKVGILSKFSMAVVGALALAMTAFASSAMASSPKFDPAPGNFKLSGVLFFTQSITIPCQVEIHVTVNSSGVATSVVPTFSPGAPQCGTDVVPFGTWTLTADSTTQATAEVGSSSILGQCFGDIVGAWANGANPSDPSTLSFSNASVPGTPSTCFVNGTLTSDPGVRIIH